MSEQVNHPEHYGGANNPYEVIKVIEAWDPITAYYGCVFSAIKYQGRLGKKDDPAVDLGKSAWYSNRAKEILQKHPIVASVVSQVRRDNGDAEEITVLMRALEAADDLIRGLHGDGKPRSSVIDWKRDHFNPAIERNGYPSSK